MSFDHSVSIAFCPLLASAISSVPPAPRLRSQKYGLYLRISAIVSALTFGRCFSALPVYFHPISAAAVGSEAA